ncbi:MAG: FAD-dependent oxidoreductase [Candidatus Falkowbacteria bacterium]
MEKYELIIIGGGPAGITAAIYAVRREMKVLLISKDLGGQLVWAGEIENYPGFTSIMNFDLIQKWEEHLKTAGVQYKLAEVSQINKKDDGNFIVHTQKESFESQTILITMGLVPRRLAIEGEMEFTGKGISYCANCDGPLYRNKIVAVVGGGNAALDAAEVLSKIAKQVYLINRSDQLRAFDGLVEEVKSRQNIEVLENNTVKKITGDTAVREMVIIDNNLSEERTIKVDGVFIEIGRIAHTDLVADLVERDERLQIKIDNRCQTSTPGVFAAGDVTNVEFKQITIASGQGTVAALAAYQYLQQKKGKKITVVFDRSK